MLLTARAHHIPILRHKATWSILRVEILLKERGVLSGVIRNP
jgi:hypothetical protein